ncbi:hypothetical protein [Abyssibacter sp.]|uniref:hypothetical protein n=1 Tax=Abyssibacter sp. TaxID=2320200 RepID=UPI003517EF6F
MPIFRIRPGRGLLGAAVVFGLAACASPKTLTDVQVTPTQNHAIFSENWSDSAPAELAACKFQLVALTDARRNRSDIGVHGSRRYVLDSPLGWVRETLLAIPTVSDETGRPTQGELLRLGVQGHSKTTSRTITIAIRLRIESSERDTVLVARGSDTSVNWAGEAEEINESLDRAASDLQQQVLREIRQLPDCMGQSPTAKLYDAPDHATR